MLGERLKMTTIKYTVKFFDTTIEWEISEEEAQIFENCKTPEAFIKYQEELLDSKDLTDFISNSVIKSGNWSIHTNDAVDCAGSWKGRY